MSGGKKGSLFDELFRGSLGQQIGQQQQQREQNFADILTKATTHKHKAEIKPLVDELARETTDKEGDIEMRALKIYRSIVRHVRAGGTVKFVSSDGTEKTLKVRLR